MEVFYLFALSAITKNISGFRQLSGFFDGSGDCNAVLRGQKKISTFEGHLFDCKIR